MKFLIISILALGQPPLEDQLPLGAEGLAGKYFGPPAAADALPGPVVTEPELNPAPGIFGLAAVLRRIDDAMKVCVTTREEISELIETDQGSYAVHPDWIDAYQDCLGNRERELSLLGDAIDGAKHKLLAGTQGDAARRAADVIARLTAAQSALKQQYRAEMAVQGQLVPRYNDGGGLDQRPTLPTSTAE